MVQGEGFEPPTSSSEWNTVIDFRSLIKLIHIKNNWGNIELKVVFTRLYQFGHSRVIKFVGAGRVTRTLRLRPFNGLLYLILVPQLNSFIC